jgi:hypothetical protein
LPKIIKNEGFKGLYKGFWPTFIREVPGWGSYFYAYEALKDILKDKDSKTTVP